MYQFDSDVSAGFRFSSLIHIYSKCDLNGSTDLDISMIHIFQCDSWAIQIQNVIQMYQLDSNLSLWLRFIRINRIQKWFKCINRNHNSLGQFRQCRIDLTIWFRLIGKIQIKQSDSDLSKRFRFKNMTQTYQCSSDWSARFTFINAMQDWSNSLIEIQIKQSDSDWSAWFK